MATEPDTHSPDGADSQTAGIEFGWLSPVAGHAGSDFQPIVMYQEEHILPQALPHFDSVWIADHFYGFDADKTEGFLEGWTTLTWLAARYPTVKLCHHVLGHGYRNPALTAKMASTLQVLSGGRFILGIGGGWREDEYLAYGYDFPKPSVRLRQLEEVVQICRLMWTEAHPTFAGEYFSIDDAAATPRPDVVPPVLIGSSGEKVGLPIVGRQADIWNGFGRDDEDWLRKRAIIDAAAEAAGRDPAAIANSRTIAGDLPTTDAESAEWLERLTAQRDLGVSIFVMDFGHPLDVEPALRFAEQVIAPMRAS
jgi:alkanesulfonate monooxygenase SsuD/methylene tetrahydromethanopterin reductase-like flavin-dependent oxidoreductase (luciferase family)